MSETDRLARIAQEEINRHEDECQRLRFIADSIVDSLEWHVRQVDGWNNYLRQLIRTEAEVIPLPCPKLTIVPDLA